MKKIVLDANVIVSAIFGGTPRKALQLAFTYEVFISSDIEQELLLLPEKLSNKLSPIQIVNFKKELTLFLSKTKIIKTKEKTDFCRDKKDNKYLNLCKEIQADFLITGDKDLIVLEKNKKITSLMPYLIITTPAGFLSRLNKSL